MKKMWKKVLALVVCVLITVSVVAVPASAYTLWKHKIEKSLTLVPYQGFSSTSRTHMRYCTNAWNSAAGKSIVFMSSSTHSAQTGYPSVDGKNYVYKQYADTNKVAETTRCQIKNIPSVSASVMTYITEADIVINTKYNWANSAKPNCYDTYSVFLHEVGHVIGLWHAESSTLPVMYENYDVNKEKRELTKDDIEGASNLYSS